MFTAFPKQRHIYSFMKRYSSASCSFETFGNQTKNPHGLIVTCEHANNLLPSDLSWGLNDIKRNLPELHWAYDPGARDFSIELAQELQCPVVLSTLSRLYVDVNRPIASSTMFRKVCDGIEVDINKELHRQTVNERIINAFVPYHLQIQRTAVDCKASTAVSIHTFNRTYEGENRSFEIGVLFSTGNEKLATKMVKILNESGFSARLNEPWSGKHGFMYSADCFTYCSNTPGERNAVMFEFRNDVCTNPEWRQQVIPIICDILTSRSNISSAS